MRSEGEVPVDAGVGEGGQRIEVFKYPHPFGSASSPKPRRRLPTNMTRRRSRASCWAGGSTF